MKKNIALFFKSLFSNSACISAGREKPWYAAVIIFILSIVISLIPTVVTLGNAYGSSFIPSTNYNMDVALQDFILDINGLNEDAEGNPLHGPVLLTVQDDDTYGKRLENPTSSAGAEYISWSEAYGSNLAPYEHMYVRQIEDEDGNIVESTVVDFQIYFFGDADNATFTRYVTNLAAGRAPDQDESSESTSRSVSFIAFGRYAFRAQIYRPGNTNAQSSYTGDYLTLPAGYTINNLGDVTMTIGEETKVITANDMANPTPELAPYFNQWKTGVFQNFKKLFDDGYITNKNTSWWMTTLITGSIFIILGLFMGLVVFFLTRGKRNPFRYFTVGDCFKIGSWAMLSPALLTLIFGFLMSQLAVIGFVLFYGMRIMWMSMRSLRPQ